MRFISVFVLASIVAIAADARLAKVPYSLPLSFESHGGTYVSSGEGYVLSLSPGGATLALRGGTVRMRMVGSNPAVRMEAAEPLPGHVTYLDGNGDGETFRTYGQVIGHSVYPGIDLVFHGNQDRLEYDFRVAAGSVAGRIALEFDGATRMEIDASGGLVLHAGEAEIRQPKPVAYQIVDGRRREVAVRYALDRAGHVRFRLGPHDSLRELAIDPVIDFDNQFGPVGSAAKAVAMDAQGNVYVVVQDFANPVGGQPPDILVNKWNAAGNQLIYSISFGGSGTDYVTGLAVDSSGSAYAVGSTTWPEFPVTANAFQKNLIGNQNTFIAKVSADGTHLVYATLLGGGQERGGSIAVDASGAAYVTGTTGGNFPVTARAFQTTPGATCTATWSYVNFPLTGDAFVAKISPDGGSLEYASYLGGSCGDYGNAIAANADGTAWVVGQTSSADFPVTADAIEKTYGGGFASGFLARVSPAGDSLEYSTFLGGGYYATVNAIALDSAGNLYLTGQSDGFSQPASAGAYQPKPIGSCYFMSFGPPEYTPDGNAFVLRLNPAGTAVTGLTYLGSACFSSGAAIAVDSAGAPWIVGFGYNTFPMASPVELQVYGGYVSKFSPDLSHLLFSTSFDTVNGVAVDASGMAYVAGAVSNGNTALLLAYVAEIDPAAVAVSLDNVLSASPFFPGPNGVGQPPAEALAPGKVIRVVGRNIGPAVQTPGSIDGGVLATNVAGVQVTFDGVAAPLLYESSTEIGCIVPYAIAGRSTTTMQVTYNGVKSNAVPVPLAATAPEVLGVFNTDFTPNSATNPAQAGSVVAIYVTGAGQTVPASVDGEIYTNPLPLPAETIAVAGDGGSVASYVPVVAFAAAAYGLADGILQVNFPLPAQVAQLENGFTLSTGTASNVFIVYVQ